MSGRDFPETEILVARGKYATLASERRDALKGLRDDMEWLADIARRVVRNPEDHDFTREQIEAAGKCLGSAQLHLHSLERLAPELLALKPLAWGKGDPE